MKNYISILLSLILFSVLSHAQSAILVNDNSFPHEIISLVENYPLNFSVETSIINNTGEVLDIKITTESKNFPTDWDVPDESPVLDEWTSIQGGSSTTVYTYLTVMTNDIRDVATGIETLRIIATDPSGNEVANQTYDINYNVILPEVPEPTFIITTFEFDSTIVDTVYIPIENPDPFSKEFYSHMEINFDDYYWVERPIVFEPTEIILENIASIECMHEDPYQLDPSLSWCSGDTIGLTSSFINYQQLFGYLGPEDDFRMEFLLNIYDPVDSLNSNQQVRFIGLPAECVYGRNANLVDIPDPYVLVCPGESVTLNARPEYGNLTWNSSTHAPSITFDNVQSSMYLYITTRDDEGCLLYQSISIEIEERYEEIVDIDPLALEICPGTDITLSLLPGFDEAQWYNEITGITVTSETYTLTDIQDYVQLIVRAANVDGCFSYQNIYLYVNEDGIEAQILDEDFHTVCAGGSLTLEVSSDYTDVKWNSLNNGEEYFGNILELDNIQDFYEIELTAQKGDCLYRQWVLIEAIYDEIYNPDILVTDINSEQCRKLTLTAADGYLNYEWYIFDFNSGDIDSISQTQEIELDFTDNLEFFNPYLQLYVTGTDGCKEFYEFEFLLKFPEERKLIDDSGTGNYCSGDQIEIAVLEDFESYQWSYQGQIYTDATFTFEAETDPVSLIVIDDRGCTYRDVFNTTVGNLDVPSLCLITNDETTGNNVILWEDPANEANINKYLIYREGTITDDFIQIGELDFSEDNLFIDADSDPAQQAYKYHVRATNECGDLSEPSNVHKTIHLTINQGTNGNVNLIWDSYEGISYDQIKIFRGSSSDNLQEYLGLPGTAFSFTDQNPPAGNVYYQIEVTTDIECDIGKAVFKIKSNVAAFQSEGDSTDELGLAGKIYPNPFTSLIYLELDQEAELQIISLDGRRMLTQKLDSGKQKISTSAFLPGAYIVKVISSDKIYAHTFIKSE